jgi:hypothetical protein
MSELATLAPEPPSLRRGTKFTPTSIRQIRNLLERGKSKEEIADIIGVTVATLQVTCSKLGISLRRPVNGEPASLKFMRPHPPNVVASVVKEGNREMAPSGDSPQSAVLRPVEPAGEMPTPAAPKMTRAPKRSESSLTTLTMQHNGEARTIELTLDRNVLGLIALEAQFRAMTMGDLISRLLAAVSNSELLAAVVEGSKTKTG